MKFSLQTRELLWGINGELLGNVSNTEDGILYRYNNRLRLKRLDAWEIYKHLLEHDYSRAGVKQFPTVN